MYLKLKALYTASVQFSRRDTRDRHLARRANLMLKRYGGNAQTESTKRADELAAAGDHNGAAVWLRVMHSVGQLENKTPPGLVH
jgi:hypothetical protein